MFFQVIWSGKWWVFITISSKNYFRKAAIWCQCQYFQILFFLSLKTSYDCNLPLKTSFFVCPNPEFLRSFDLIDNPNQINLLPLMACIVSLTIEDRSFSVRHLVSMLSAYRGSMDLLVFPGNEAYKCKPLYLFSHQILWIFKEHTDKTVYTSYCYRACCLRRQLLFLPLSSPKTYLSFPSRYYLPPSLHSSSLSSAVFVWFGVLFVLFWFYFPKLQWLSLFISVRKLECIRK